MGTLNFFYIALALVFSFVLIRNTVRQRIVERESIVWLLLIVVMIVFSIWPQLLMRISDLLGVAYAPTLLFLVSTLCLVYIVYKQSMALSRLHREFRELAQRNAIIEGQVRKWVEKE